jgi:hypothetical protein
MGWTLIPNEAMPTQKNNNPDKKVKIMRTTTIPTLMPTPTIPTCV